MFHISNFGSFAGPIVAYADFSGYVPEPGDRLQDFHYVWGPSSEEWDEFVEAAAAATEEAEALLREWREE